MARAPRWMWARTTSVIGMEWRMSELLTTKCSLSERKERALRMPPPVFSRTSSGKNAQLMSGKLVSRCDWTRWPRW